LAATAGVFFTHYTGGIGPSEAGALKSVRYLALAAAGLLAGRRYTCYPGIEQQISDGEWQDRLVVSDGPIWTGQGPAATIDLALSVIAAACGRDRAREVAQGLLWHKLAAGSRGDD
ncbi:MAG: DJ-1/PfpI family protein, partial [Negativicutes bacterium]|nr:DJ-1/PfpI family protein [Negativicutes bacterium]